MRTLFALATGSRTLRLLHNTQRVGDLLALTSDPADGVIGLVDRGRRCSSGSHDEGMRSLEIWGN